MALRGAFAFHSVKWSSEAARVVKEVVLGENMKKLSTTLDSLIELVLPSRT